MEMKHIRSLLFLALAFVHGCQPLPAQDALKVDRRGSPVAATPLNLASPNVRGFVADAFFSRLPRGYKIRGFNLAPAYSHQGSWRAFFGPGWDWSSGSIYSAKAQIDKARALGANSIRCIAGFDGVEMGLYSQETLFARLDQIIDYADSLGLYCYPCAGDLASATVWNRTQARDYVVAFVQRMQLHPNVFAIDICNEADGGNPVSMAPWVVDVDTAAFYTAAKVVAKVPLSNSRIATCSGNVPMLTPAFVDGWNTSCDFFDCHTYYAALPSDYQLIRGKNKPILHGEFGNNAALGASAPVANMDAIFHAPQDVGGFMFCLYDFGDADVSKFGTVNPATGALIPYAAGYATLPTSDSDYTGPKDVVNKSVASVGPNSGYRFTDRTTGASYELVAFGGQMHLYGPGGQLMQGDVSVMSFPGLLGAGGFNTTDASTGSAWALHASDGAFSLYTNGGGAYTAQVDQATGRWTIPGGIVTATPAVGDSSTKVATTAFVAAAVGTSGGSSFDPASPGEIGNDTPDAASFTSLLVSGNAVVAGGLSVFGNINAANYDLAVVPGTLPIAKGGTGATTKAAALNNLVNGQDIAPKNILAGTTSGGSVLIRGLNDAYNVGMATDGGGNINFVGPYAGGRAQLSVGGVSCFGDFALYGSITLISGGAVQGMLVGVAGGAKLVDSGGVNGGRLTLGQLNLSDLQTSPTSPKVLVSGELWRDGTTLHIVP